ncbi:RHS repeat-associated core domain-containing protein, partial [Ramlibacter sp.]|uniref:RHS repeat-associated core domain-containing protein n=1 Tax=Ramlibacter sp. TaxID=1917967 RepID=UPI003D0E3F44
VWQWPYSAFGDNKPTGILAATPNPQVALTNRPLLLKTTSPRQGLDLAFAGQVRDEESGLSYNGYRYFWALGGIYTQGDRIGLSGGMNRYGYANTNPFKFTDPYGLFGWADMPALPRSTVDFIAGFGDSMSFGLTGYARTAMDINETDQCSEAYAAGEIADLLFQTGAFGLSVGLKALAANASRTGARDAARPFVSGFRSNGQYRGGYVHHSNPLFGHPGGAPAMFPTGGLPASMHSGAWNLKWFADGTSHSAAHQAMRRMESGWAAFNNPAATGARAARDVAQSCFCR